METKLQELLETALRERFELAALALRQESGEYAQMTMRLVTLSDQIHNTQDISAEMKEIIADYLALAAEMDDVFREHLYRQGARDCVAALRELDLIKHENGGG